MANERTFYITWAGETWQAFPFDIDNLKFVYQKEKDFAFRRKTLSGSLTFKNSDFQKLKTIDLSNLRCDELLIDIYRDCGGFSQLEWKGYFTMQMCRFDLDRCEVSTTAEPNDEYRCIFNRWEEQFNMFETCDLFETVQNIGSLQQCSFVGHSCFADPMPCAGSSINDMYANGWTVTYHSASDAPVNECDPSCGDDQPCYRITTIWSRQLITLDCVDGSCVDVAPPDDSWILVDEADCECEECCCCYAAPTRNLTYRGVRYNCLIENTVTNICPSIEEMTSIFLNNNPDTDSTFYEGGDNYVTHTADYANLMISQKSDVISPEATNPATIGMYSLKLLLDWARVVLNCYWDIVYDSSSGTYKLRVEHLSFYERQGFDIDLTDPIYQPDVKSLNKYEHIRGELPSKETFKFMEAINQDFVGVPINYSVNCTSEKLTESYVAEQLTTDVKAAIDFPQKISVDGFYMLAIGMYFTSPFLLSDTGRLSGLPYINGVLSWANLHYDLHRHGRVLAEGVMNSTDEDFFSFRENTRQVPNIICFKCQTLDPLKQVQTELGETYFNGIKGNIQLAEINLGSDQLTLILAYQYRYQEYPFNIELRDDGGAELRDDGGFELLDN